MAQSYIKWICVRGFLELINSQRNQDVTTSSEKSKNTEVGGRQEYWSECANRCRPGHRPQSIAFHQIQFLCMSMVRNYLQYCQFSTIYRVVGELRQKQITPNVDSTHTVIKCLFLLHFQVFLSMLEFIYTEWLVYSKCYVSFYLKKIWK